MAKRISTEECEGLKLVLEGLKKSTSSHQTKERLVEICSIAKFQEHVDLIDGLMAIKLLPVDLSVIYTIGMETIIKWILDDCEIENPT